MQSQVPWVNRAREFLDGFSTTEWRLLVTAGLVGLTLVLGWVVLPRVARLVDRPLRDRLVPDEFADATETFGGYIPATPSGVLLWIAQVELHVVAALSLLVLWDRPGVVAWMTDRVVDQIPLIRNLLVSLVVLVLAYAGAAALSDWIEDMSTQAEWMTDHQEEILLRVSQLALFGLMGLVLLGLWGIDLGGLLVGAGFLGIVVGLAARQTLGSLIAGFVLMFARPFTIGDWVEVGDQEGIVTEITILNTRLENFDGEYVIIPNDQVSNQPITNRSQKGLLRLRVEVGVDYESDPERACELARETISDLPEVIDAPPPEVFPKSFGDSAVVLELRFWIDHPTPPRKWKAVSAVISNVKSAFEAEGIKIPFPQRELTGRAESGGFRVHRPGVADSTDGTVDAAPEPSEHD